MPPIKQADKEQHRLYVLCKGESITSAKVQAAQKGESLAVTLGAAIDKAFANRKPSSKG